MRKYGFTAIACLVTSILACTAMSAEPIVYSGANRNVVYDQYSTPPAFSLFGAPGNWDDIRLYLDAYADPG